MRPSGAVRRDAVLGALLVLFGFTGVFDHGLWGTNDTRGAAMLSDMRSHGTLVVPTINGEPYLEKPPLMHWAALGLAAIVGGVTEGVARLPSALAGLGTLLLMRLFVEEALAAWAGIFLCATSITFLGYARAVMTDMPLTFCVALALYLFWRADREGRTGVLRWLPFLLAAAGSFYAKALAGPGLVWSAVGVYLLWTRRPRLLLSLFAAFVPLLAGAVAPWLLAVRRALGNDALYYMFWTNQAGRFLDLTTPNMPTNPLTAHKESITYYLTHLPEAIGASVPLVLAALVVLWRPASPYRSRFATFLRCTIVGMLLLLHASTARTSVYALPVFPFFFMATGVWLADFAARPAPAFFERALSWLSAAAWTLLVVGPPVALIVLTFERPDLFLPAEGLARGRFLVIGALCLAAVLLSLRVCLRQVRIGRREVVIPLLPAAGALLLFLDYQAAAPLLERHRSYEPLIRFVREESAGRQLALASVEYNMIGAFTYYLDRRLPILPGPPEVAAYLAEPRARAVIAARRDMRRIDPSLAGVPHEELACPDPGLRGKDFLLLRNLAPVRPGSDSAGQQDRDRVALRIGRDRVGLSVPVEVGEQDAPRSPATVRNVDGAGRR